MRFLICGVALLFLGACAATGPAEYGPADSKGFGFDEQRIEDSRYRVTYRGSGGMPPELVEDYALRRAAELTRANGFEWFLVTSRDVVGEERGGVSVGTGFGSSSYGRRSSVGVGVGANLGKIGAQDFFTARIEILMGEGEKPQDVRVFDADSVLNSLSGPEPYRYEEE